jgi:hypothetical protein
MGVFLQASHWLGKQRRFRDGILVIGADLHLSNAFYISRFPCRLKIILIAGDCTFPMLRETSFDNALRHVANDVAATSKRCRDNLEGPRHRIVSEIVDLLISIAWLSRSTVMNLRIQGSMGHLALNQPAIRD